MNLLYEKYHSDRKTQIRIVGNDDFTYKNLLNLVAKHIKNKSNILDIGCGVGTIDFYLVKIGGNVLGIDISKNAILVAKKNAENLRLNKKIKFKVVNFPNEIPKGKFNIVICSEVLEHLENDKLSVSRMKNILQKDGIVIASSPSLNAPLYKMGFLKNFDKEVGHLRRYTEKSFKNLFENSGFKVLETKKTEGILRNFFFTNDLGGQFLRILNKKPFSNIVTFIDNLTIPLFGESDIYLVAQKK